MDKQELSQGEMSIRADGQGCFKREKQKNVKGSDKKQNMIKIEGNWHRCYCYSFIDIIIWISILHNNICYHYGGIIMSQVVY